MLTLATLGYVLTGLQEPRIYNAVCTSPEYASVKAGISKKEVVVLLGEPSTKHIKRSSNENFFYQGENEANIKEGWVYESSDWKKAEIYFDNSGRVYGKGCGQG